MRHLAKTVFLTTQGTTARIERDALRIERPDEAFVRIPLRSVDSIVAMGHINLTTDLIHRAASDGVGIVLLTRSGRFVARVVGPTSGNIHLRQRQYRALDDAERCREIAKCIVAAKLLNSRVVLLDVAKDRADRAAELRSVADALAQHAEQSRHALLLDQLRGIEGMGAKRYLDILGTLPSEPRFRFEGRSRRPPRDPTNALLSFLYALLRTRCVGALESVGLDPQAGYLHTVRPGRPSLALDLMEELRAPFADRHALTVLNRRQLTERHFIDRPGGSWELTDDGRTALLRTWDSFLDGEITHRAYGQRMQRRQVPHMQALLLARHLRGDLQHYLPYRTLAR